MRTALLAWDYPPSPSGLSTAAREIAESLAALGVAVTVLTLDRVGTQEMGGVTVQGLALAPGTPLARLRRLGSLGHLAAPLALRRAVLAAHARAPFDLVEATNWYAPAALLTGGPPLVTRNSTPAGLTLDAATSLRDRLDGRTARGLERRQARRSAGLISNTAAHAERIAAEYDLSGRQPHAVIGLSLPPEVRDRGRDAPYPAGEGTLRLLFVGRAEHRKGFDTLLAAVARLDGEAARGAVPPFRVALVGVAEADLPADLTPAVRARLAPLGRVAMARLGEEYARAHAVLAPSRYESFGLVYQEALAYGRPVVACAEDASARAFVGEPGAGLLAAEASGPALADAIRPLLTDPARRETLRHRARAAAGRFDRRRLGEETLALYREVLARARGAAG